MAEPQRMAEPQESDYEESDYANVSDTDYVEVLPE
ncbi:hypothetical protein CgunFtcFv8_015447 [Champsocephalus gunnari]|nr:hypothetical protein CgunFtcFv8_015447 [Champsocephalus gunnari]